MAKKVWDRDSFMSMGLLYQFLFILSIGFQGRIRHFRYQERYTVGLIRIPSCQKYSMLR